MWGNCILKREDTDQQYIHRHTDIGHLHTSQPSRLYLTLCFNSFVQKYSLCLTQSTIVNFRYLDIRSTCWHPSMAFSSAHVFNKSLRCWCG
ncbi:hypothetical protein OPQ81_011791 [Rhizoctonia solani]|nr:hypothetical protein OPQ81_011791 [Rhizoctonia solani]